MTLSKLYGLCFWPDEQFSINFLDIAKICQQMGLYMSPFKYSDNTESLEIKCRAKKKKEKLNLTLKIWHRLSNALSRNSWVFFKHSPFSSGSTLEKGLMTSEEPKPNQDRRKVFAAASLEWSDILFAVCLACAMIWISFMTCKINGHYSLWTQFQVAGRVFQKKTLYCVLPMGL